MLNIDSILSAHGVSKIGEGKESRQLKKLIANYEAHLDIDERVVGDTGKFYDLFDGTNNHSIGQLDTFNTTISESVSASATEISVVNPDESLLGKEVTIQDATNIERHIVSEVINVDNSVTHTDTTTSDFEAGTSTNTKIADGSMALRSVVYGVCIDQSNPNPLTSVTYTDDAVGMSGASLEWDSMFPFSIIRPCVLNNPAGTVNYYLDKTDYSKKADGTASDITSGSAGDVMIEIPKMAYSIVTVGNLVYIKVTNNPSPTNGANEDWCFNAHTRVTQGDKNNLYVGAYLGNTISSKLRSLSGKAPTATQTIGTFRTQAQANGSGYDQLGFFPLTLLQILYLLRYKSLDSQTALGRGYVDDNASAVNTGGTNAKGFYYGETTGKLQMKFMGIEDFWGNCYYWIDGLFSNASRNILTAFTSFNDTGSGYTNRGEGATANLGNYMSKIQGGSNTGFIAKEVAGSTTTYYSDYTYLYASYLPIFGGSWASVSNAGAFLLYVSRSASESIASVSARLMFL